MEVIRGLLSQEARTQLADVQIGRNSVGEPIWIDIAKLTGNTVGGSTPPAEVTSWTKAGDLTGSLNDAQVSALEATRAALGTAAYSPEYWTAVEQAGKVLKPLGELALAVDAAIEGYKAYKEFAAGNTAAGLEIVRDWAFGAVGAMAAGGIAFQGAAWLLGAAGIAALGPLGIGVGVVGIIGASLVSAYYGHEAGQWLGDKVTTAFSAAQTFVPRRDPLVLDLDGDGIETVGVNAANPIYFDHDGDGNQTSSGWVKADDGFLVLDRNGNGTIDNGTELFGDATPLSGGGKAADGFDALAQEDTNADGKVDDQDTNWNNLRVWRDLNQDGVSQSGELFTLDSLGIAALNVASTSHAQVLANGNRITELGSYIKTDGSQSGMGETSKTADVDLAEDTFHSQFTEHITLTTQSQGLPEVQGSGQVRSLREATSLSPTLADLLTQFGEASRAEQNGLMDAILKAWADTSTMPTTFSGAYAGHALTVNMQWAAAGSSDYLA